MGKSSRPDSSGRISVCCYKEKSHAWTLGSVQSLLVAQQEMLSGGAQFGSAETQGASQEQAMQYVRLLWFELDRGTSDLQCQDQRFASVCRALFIDANGVFEALSGSERAGLSMSGKRTAVELVVRQKLC